MSVKKWVIAVVAVSVGSPFAVGALGMLGIGPGFHVEVPEWEAGYEWRYDSTMAMLASESFMGEHESEQFELRGESQRVVGNTTLILDEVPVYAVAEQFIPKTAKVNGELVFDADQSDAGVDDFGFVGCMLFCTGEYGFYTREHLNPFFDGHGDWESAQVRLLDFPLKRKSWMVMSDDSMEVEGEPMKFEVEARAVGTGLVNLGGLGAMDAVRIEAALTPESVESFKRAMRLDMAEEHVPGLSVRVDVDYRMTYWFAQEAKQIVRMDSSFVFDVRLSYEGETMAARMEFRASDVLKSYSLVAGPERSLGEIQRINRLLDELPEVRELSDQRWPFTLAASKFSAKATSGEVVRLGLLAGPGSGDVIAEKFDAVPDGMTVEWRHRYLESQNSHIGSKVERYSGSSLELPLRVQGLHEVTAYLLDKDGKLVGADSMILEGYGQWTQSDSMPAGMIGLFQPRPLEFETSMFLDEVKMRIRAGNAGMGYAEYHGPGAEGDFDVLNSEEHTVNGFDPEAYGIWTLEYRDTARAGLLEMHVEARYDRSQDPSPYLRGASPGQSQVVGGFPMFFGGMAGECQGRMPGCGFQAAQGSLAENLRGNLRTLL
jgi:hypothetical protein